MHFVLFHIISYIITLWLHGTHTRWGENSKLYNSIFDTVRYYILVCKRSSLCIVSIGMVQLIFVYQNFLPSFSAPICLRNFLKSVGMSGVFFSIRLQCSSQKALFLTGELVHTFGRCMFGTPQTMFCKVMISSLYIYNYYTSLWRWACIPTSIWYRQWGNVSFQIPSVTQRQPQPLKCETNMITSSYTQIINNHNLL